MQLLPAAAPQTIIPNQQEFFLKRLWLKMKQQTKINRAGKVVPAYFNALCSLAFPGNDKVLKL